MSQSVIEEDLTIDGNITSDGGDVHVKGSVTGDITARAVDVHTTGQVKGAIEADQVKIQGKQSGRIKCAELALEKLAEVKSDVTAQTLSSEKGARLIGKVQITGG
jgi:cytoskeletal protein CcmA (bactofilin family)